VLGLIALFVALGGTALAATGQLVNIADGTNAANLAKVDSLGALRTAPSTVPVPAKPFSAASSVPNAFTAYGVVFSGATSATIAINRIVIADDNTKPAARDVLLYQVALNAGETACRATGGFSEPLTLIGRYTVPASGTVLDEMPTPMLLKPINGKPWCLIAGSFAPTSTNTGLPRLQVTGWTVSGTPPAGTAARQSSSAPLRDPAAGR
jgi:hypothetical protein